MNHRYDPYKKTRPRKAEVRRRRKSVITRKLEPTRAERRKGNKTARAEKFRENGE